MPNESKSSEHSEPILQKKIEWKEYKLGEVITLQRGVDLPKNKMEKGRYPVAGSNGIIGYHNCHTTNGPGVTIGRSGNIGAVHFYESDFWAHNTSLYVKDFKGNDERYIYYFLKTIDFSQFNTGSAVPSLNRNHIHELSVRLPPLSEQKRIASILSSLDDKIDLLHRENATLEAMAETLFRHHFIENPNPDWKEGKLGDEFEFTMGQSPAGDSFNDEGIGIPMFQGNADFGFRFPTKRVFTTRPTRLAKANDTLISVRAPVGTQNMAIEECCIGRGVAAFRYRKKSSFYSYTYYKLRVLLEIIKQFDDNGTVFGSISKSDFENIDILIPGEDEIESFQNQSKAIDDKIINNNHQIQTLTQMRNRLLQKQISNKEME